MKKIVVGLIASLALSALGGIATAKAANEGSFSAQLAPFPKLAAWGDQLGITEPGCLAGEQDVHWHAEEFVAPKNGTLTIASSGFTGDFDLYIKDAEGTIIARSENDQIQGQAAPEEETSALLKKKATVSMLVCNWLGAPDVTVDWVFTPAKKKK